jgi:hypothetical protein
MIPQNSQACSVTLICGPRSRRPKTTDSPRPSLGSGAVGVYSTQSHWSQPGGGSDDREEDAGDDREEENEHCDGHAESEPSLGWPEGMAQGQGR